MSAASNSKRSVPFPLFLRLMRPFFGFHQFFALHHDSFRRARPHQSEKRAVDRLEVRCEAR